mmetsp:Transcript_35959/g.90567  ORF Transcript_35959/g.90567 Transcript_35959/m.90567 type:complete len:110 (+) Transcript_35959:1664-1993(+)
MPGESECRLWREKRVKTHQQGKTNVRKAKQQLGLHNTSVHTIQPFSLTVLLVPEHSPQVAPRPQVFLATCSAPTGCLFLHSYVSFLRCVCGVFLLGIDLWEFGWMPCLL